MGVVYEAFDRERDAVVALMTLRHVDPQALYRLKHEFRALQDIAHGNLVTLGELIEDGGQWFFTMELVDGVDLRAWVRGEEPATDDSDALLPTETAVGAAAAAAGRAPD